MDENYKRINILIRPDQHELITGRGLSLSGLVRDLIDDRFNENKITLSMSDRSRELYDNIVSNFGVGDTELERFFVQALDAFLESRSEDIKELRAELKSATAKKRTKKSKK